MADAIRSAGPGARGANHPAPADLDDSAGARTVHRRGRGPRLGSTAADHSTPAAARGTRRAPDARFAGRSALHGHRERRYAGRNTVRVRRSKLARRASTHVESFGVRLVLLSLVAAATPVLAAAQSRPVVSAPAAPYYARLLPAITRIKIFDHHAHPGFADDPEVDAAPAPAGS